MVSTSPGRGGAVASRAGWALGRQMASAARSQVESVFSTTAPEVKPSGKETRIWPVVSRTTWKLVMTRPWVWLTATSTPEPSEAPSWSMLVTRTTAGCGVCAAGGKTTASPARWNPPQARSRSPTIASRGFPPLSGGDCPDFCGRAPREARLPQKWDCPLRPPSAREGDAVFFFFGRRAAEVEPPATGRHGRFRNQRRHIRQRRTGRAWQPSGSHPAGTAPHSRRTQPAGLEKVGLTSSGRSGRRRSCPSRPEGVGRGVVFASTGQGWPPRGPPPPSRPCSVPAWRGPSSKG